MLTKFIILIQILKILQENLIFKIQLSALLFEKIKFTKILHNGLEFDCVYELRIE